MRFYRTSQLSATALLALFSWRPTSAQWLGANPPIYYTGGNVGIGTTSPAVKLHIASSSAQDGILIDTPTYPELEFARSGTGKAYVAIAGAAGGWFGTSVLDELAIRAENGPIGFGKGSSEYMRIDSGSVEIGFMGAPSSLVGVACPGGTGCPSSSTGSLASGTYYFVIVALDPAAHVSSASNEVSVTVNGSTTKSVNLTWTGVPGAAVYRIYYGTSAGAENQYQLSGAEGFSPPSAYRNGFEINYIFTTTTGPSGTVPSASGAFGTSLGGATAWLSLGNSALWSSPGLAMEGSAARFLQVSDGNHTTPTTDYTSSVVWERVDASNPPPAGSSGNGIIIPWAFSVHKQQGASSTAGAGGILYSLMVDTLVDDPTMSETESWFNTKCNPQPTLPNSIFPTPKCQALTVQTRREASGWYGVGIELIVNNDSGTDAPFNNVGNGASNTSTVGIALESGTNKNTFGITIDGGFQRGLAFSTGYTYGIDFSPNSSAGAGGNPIRFANGNVIVWRNAADSSDLSTVWVDSSNVLNLGLTTQFTTLTGSGNAFACLNSSGALYRSATACM